MTTYTTKLLDSYYLLLKVIRQFRDWNGINTRRLSLKFCKYIQERLALQFGIRIMWMYYVCQKKSSELNCRDSKWSGSSENIAPLSTDEDKEDGRAGILSSTGEVDRGISER